MIIYPPYIADTIPAFTVEEIVIPFKQNPAVSIEEVSSFGLAVRDYTNGNVIATLTATTDTLLYNNSQKTGSIKFDINHWRNNVKKIISLAEAAGDITAEEAAERRAAADKFPEATQYYKFQLSYSDNGKYEAYSSVSIGRCIGSASNNFGISVIGWEKELSSTILNIDTTTYTGKYTTNIVSEPLYSYRFVFKNKNTQEIIQDTGNVTHNADNDTVDTKKKIRTSSHKFKLKYELDFDYDYELTYSVTTINNYTVSQTYPIIKSGQLPTTFQGSLLVSQDAAAIENGYVNLQVYNTQPYRGTFVIERTSDEYQWDELTKFNLTHLSDISEFNWKDWSVEQGIEYIYAIRQVYDNQYSERIKSKPIKVEFEHMYLSDGEKQLKIKYNPKVSSFKEVIQEQKTDTIGGKYPFIFRNNAVRYKEIPISGLLSYLSDEDELFTSVAELKLSNLTELKKKGTKLQGMFDQFDMRSTDLTNNNYYSERVFKLKVLDWLNNGKPKLFRSPAEGNYVVRLMNVSLSPNDTLGRMLHTFSSTGFEIMDNNVETLVSNQLIHFAEKSDSPYAKTIETLTLEWIGDEETKIFTGKNIENIQWHTTLPQITDPSTGLQTNNIIKIDGKPYYNTSGILTTPSNMFFETIEVTKDVLLNGSISFYYLPDVTDLLGEDTYSKMVEASEDVLFSIPQGYTFYDTNPVLIDEEYNRTSIYKTYIIAIRRDINAPYTNLEDYQFTIGDTIIDCSDGQVRYYYDLNPSLTYEKGLGLHVDVYARIQTDGASNRLGAFILGRSHLGA